MAVAMTVAKLAKVPVLLLLLLLLLLLAGGTPTVAKLPQGTR
jgi:hypothetical protein